LSARNGLALLQGCRRRRGLFRSTFLKVEKTSLIFCLCSLATNNPVLLNRLQLDDFLECELLRDLLPPPPLDLSPPLPPAKATPPLRLWPDSPRSGEEYFLDLALDALKHKSFGVLLFG
jgi:hypothetical protein